MKTEVKYKSYEKHFYVKKGAPLFLEAFVIDRFLR